MRTSTDINHTQKPTQGFTIVEVIVTVAITALFLTLFFQMYFTMESQRINVARQALASDIANSNLRKFTIRPTIPTCNDSEMNPSTGTGYILGDDTNVDAPSPFGFRAEPESKTKMLGANIHQTVKAYAPKGCSSPTFATDPIKIESTVSYGTNGEKVVHATFVN